ncbi:MAG: V-type ATP synthase subunit D [Spirochaetes bacterium]|nr:V-type ATP synthase subunit D [Spirochaetota bacterium]NLJ05731.1 V-type ATP synthase subunit D [Exilispira sp.]MBP8991518.1 V-type ATP synthase subunit D [Spirochaetota bacterium]HOV46403.1 V-type ATP synthase subunit D [Exilispira sp.]HPB48549.1 V-type ATP synthase subunit D [Exilispira sp.]
MNIKVTATRMQLMQLKKRLKLAYKGHKLLKDKQDQLVREFFTIIDSYKNLRKQVEKELNKAYSSMVLARSVMNDLELSNALFLPTKKISLNEKLKNVMSVRIPIFKVDIENISEQPYSKISTPCELDIAIDTFSQVVSDLINLSQVENEVKLLAKEIEVTRRRVNALEYIMIPELESAIKIVSMKINELERSNLVRIMKIKDIVRKSNPQ